MKLPLEPDDRRFALSPAKAALKRTFDLAVAISIAPVVLPVSAVLVMVARLDTGKPGIFAQERIGLYGEPFMIYKVRTMRSVPGIETTVTAGNDPRITKFGRFVRRAKLDEFPQLWNVLRGDMSFVGPRPDTGEVYEALSQADARVLCVRPGITGPATIAFNREERMLADVSEPEKYNKEVIFPQKVRANLDYIDNYSLAADIAIMWRTVFG